MKFDKSKTFVLYNRPIATPSVTCHLLSIRRDPHKDYGSHGLEDTD